MPFYALLKKEIYRFSSIWIQTFIGPLSTALLYELIFGHQLSGMITGIAGISYNQFLIPGLVMMQVLMNSFGNASSSLIQSKYSGNIIFILMAPISNFMIYNAYLISSVLRGVLVGIIVYLGIIAFGFMIPLKLWAVIYFLIMGSALTAGLGIIAGIISEKFEQLAAFQSFIMTPLIYLAGIFYNVDNLSPLWHRLAQLDPFLYIVNGFRYGFSGYSNENIYEIAIFVLLSGIIINLLAYTLIARGVKIKR